MTPKQLQRVLSRATLILAALGGGYLWMRYELMTLPESGCSPLAQVAPGSLMWIDLSPGALRPGDAVFFELADGRLALAQIEREEAGGFWLVTDMSDCPAESSLTQGLISPDRIHGRLIMALRP